MIKMSDKEKTKQSAEQIADDVMPAPVNPIEKNQKGARRIGLWLIIIGMLLVFGLMLTENKDSEPPNATEIEMFEKQKLDDANSNKTDLRTSPNGKYSEEEVGKASGKHVMDDAWRGGDTTPADKSVDVDKLDEYQEKIMPKDK